MNAPTPLVYDDPHLAVAVQQVVLAMPWVNQPVPTDFSFEDLPRMQVPVMSWVIQDTEERWRERLWTHLNTIMDDDHTAAIKALPGNYITAIVANIFFNTRTYIDCVFPPRLDEELIDHPYAAPAYWIAYHLCDILIASEVKADKAESPYRIKQLRDLRRIMGFMMRAVLTTFPKIEPDNKVIIGATKNKSTRSTVYADANNLEIYFENGGTIDKLTIDWYNDRTNPVVK